MFRPLFPHALAQNVRVVSVNQREYPGSSLFNQREMDNLSSQDPQRQATWLREQGIEIAMFMARFIETEKLPPIDHVDGKDTGGVCLLAWSQGNSLLLSLLANISAIDAHTTSILKRYLRIVFAYGQCTLDKAGSRGTSHKIYDPHVLQIYLVSYSV